MSRKKVADEDADTMAADLLGGGDNAGPVAKDRLLHYVTQIENVEEDIKALNGDKKEWYAAAKGEGFDTKTLRKIISLRKKSQEERSEEEAMLDLYMQALGMLPE